MCYSMVMAKKVTKKSQRTTVRFEPDRVFFMIAVVSALTLVFVGLLTTL